MHNILHHNHVRAGAIALACTIVLYPASAQEAVPEFDCNRLNNSIAEIFTGIAPPQPVHANGILLKKNAVLLTDQRALQYKKLRLSDDSFAIAPKKKNPTVFREYMVAAEMRMCTAEKRHDLTGKPRGRYRLSCLIDANGDDRYEAIVPTGQIVRYNRLTRKNVGYPYPPHPPRALPAPVTVVEDSAMVVASAQLQPHVNIKYSVAAADENSAAIRINAAVSMLPKEDRFEDWADQEVVPVPLSGNTVQQIGAINLTFSKPGKKWMASAASRNATPVTLQCDGTIIALPQSYTILYPKGQAVLKRR